MEWWLWDRIVLPEALILRLTRSHRLFERQKGFWQGPTPGATLNIFSEQNETDEQLHRCLQLPISAALPSGSDGVEEL